MSEAWKSAFDEEEKEGVTLKVDQEGQPADCVLQTACAALLVEMARADQTIAPTESVTVVALLSKEFGIEKSEVPPIIQSAVAARKTQGNADEFFKCINTRYNPDQKVRLLALIFRVLLADKDAAEEEEKLANEMRRRLKLNETQADDARHMVESKQV
jgi:uncharacterized tellurite resistance protein B-like protein